MTATDPPPPVPAPAEAAPRPPLRVGDLVRVRLVCEIYHGIVTGSPATNKGRATVFLGNGLTVEADPDDLEPVPLYFQSPCVTSFAEILKAELTR